MPTLIPHGITPTGVGLRLRTNGTLRPLSPCCGSKMHGEFLTCGRCNTVYVHVQEAVDATLGNDVTIFSGSQSIIQSWVRKITGIEDLEVTFS